MAALGPGDEAQSDYLSFPLFSMIYFKMSPISRIFSRFRCQVMGHRTLRLPSGARNSRLTSFVPNSMELRASIKY